MLQVIKRTCLFLSDPILINVDAKLGRFQTPRKATAHNPFIVLGCVWKEPALLPYQKVSTKFTKSNLPNQTYQAKPTKLNLPNQTYQTKPTKPNLLNQTYQTKPTKPNLLHQITGQSSQRLGP